MRQPLKLRTLALAALATVVVAEGLTRVTYAVTGAAPPHADRTRHLEWTWAAQVLAAGAYAAPADTVFDPRLGYRMAPGRDEAGVRTNAAGLRADREFEPTPESGVRRVLLVGDSYTWGWSVANEETWAACLERSLPGWEVLNLGVPGYGVDQAVLAYEEIGAAYAPDVVVLGFFVRDFFRNEVGFRGYAKPRFVLAAGDRLRRVDEHLVPPAQLAAAYLDGERTMGGWDYSYLWSLLSSTWARSPYARSGLNAESPTMRLMAGLLRRFRDQTTERGAVPFLLVLPERLDKHQGTHWQTIEELVLQEAGDLGLAVRSVTPRFGAEERLHPEVPLNPDHLSVRGNEVVAEELRLGLFEAGLISDAPFPPEGE